MHSATTQVIPSSVRGPSSGPEQRRSGWSDRDAGRDRPLDQTLISRRGGYTACHTRRRRSGPLGYRTSVRATGRLAEELMRVMGVDPGLTRCGLSGVEHRGGRQIIAREGDVVRTPADVPLPRRLLTISEHVEHWLDTHRPDVVAIERVFSQQNVPTVMGTAQAGGVIALAAAKRDIDVHFHTPSEVKAAVTGNGAADKAQVTAMVTRILGLQAKPTPADAADALALAICHCWRAPMLARMAAAEALAAQQRHAYRAKLAAQAKIARAGAGRLSPRCAVRCSTWHSIMQ